MPHANGLLNRPCCWCVQDQVVFRLKECIDDFKEIMPLVEELANPALKRRHWDNIFDLIGADDIPRNENGTGEVLTY